MPEAPKQRVAYIDWLRGLACVLMFQTHCYDSWLSPAARHSSFFGWSQLGGTLPAPLFLFIAGISFALVTDRLRRKGMTRNQIAAQTIRRGAEIFAFGLLFRLQEFVLGWGHAPSTDLLRVDILNTIGLSMIFMGLVCRLARTRTANIILAACTALVISLLTPPLWTSWQPRWLPWYVESYVNGVHIYGRPQSWLFPVFPWSAFAFAGLAVGFLLFTNWAAKNQVRLLTAIGVAGAAIFLLSIALDALPLRIYAIYDYWHTSPQFFLARAGVLMILMFAGYAWCRWGFGQRGFSPLVQLGQTSLLVYWVHIEFVYGSLSILGKRAQSVPMATLGLLAIFTSMVLLSMARTKWKGRGVEVRERIRRSLRPALES